MKKLARPKRPPRTAPARPKGPGQIPRPSGPSAPGKGGGKGGGKGK